MGPKEQGEILFLLSRTQVEMDSAQSLQRAQVSQESWTRVRVRGGGMVEGVLVWL